VALIIALSSSSALMLLASSPSNAIVFSTGFLEQKNFRLNGIIYGLLGPLLAIVWVLLDLNYMLIFNGIKAFMSNISQYSK